MRKLKLIFLLLLILAGTGAFLKLHQHHEYHKPVVQPKHCSSVYAPCFEISMPNNPTYQINGWQHYGDSNCVAFNSLPDNIIHGYCGVYTISYLKRHTVVN